MNSPAIQRNESGSVSNSPNATINNTINNYGISQDQVESIVKSTIKSVLQWLGKDGYETETEEIEEDDSEDLTGDENLTGDDLSDDDEEDEEYQLRVLEARISSLEKENSEFNALIIKWEAIAARQEAAINSLMKGEDEV